MKLPRLKAIREIRGVSQLELSKASGVSAASIADYESGEGNAPQSTAWRLAGCLAVPVEQLMRDPGEASGAVMARLASTKGVWRRGEYLQARLENAFPQLFDRARLPEEQIEENYESAQLILEDLGRNMSIPEADALFEAKRPTLSAEELRQLCVGLYHYQLNNRARLP